MKILCFDVSCFIVLFIYTLQLRLRVNTLLKLTAWKIEQPTSICRHQLSSFFKVYYRICTDGHIRIEIAIQSMLHRSQFEVIATKILPSSSFTGRSLLNVYLANGNGSFPFLLYIFLFFPLSPTYFFPLFPLLRILSNMATILLNTTITYP